MWGIESWGTMIWGGTATAVPLLSPWGLCALLAAFLAGGIIMLRRPSARFMMGSLCAAALIVPLAAYAGNVIGLLTFANGTLADADDVNANFTNVAGEIDDNDARLDALEASRTIVVTSQQFLAPGASVDVIHAGNTEDIFVQTWKVTAQGSLRLNSPSSFLIEQLDANTVRVTNSTGNGETVKIKIETKI